MLINGWAPAWNIHGVIDDDLFWGMCPALAVAGGRPWSVHRDRLWVITDRILEVPTSAPSEAAQEPETAPTETASDFGESTAASESSWQHMPPSSAPSEVSWQDLDGALTTGALEVLLPTKAGKGEKAPPSEFGESTAAPSGSSAFGESTSPSDTSWQLAGDGASDISVPPSVIALSDLEMEPPSSVIALPSVIAVPPSSAGSWHDADEMD